ncbi:MAG: response regulator transcription factor [Pseudanabaenaceae cyanobacterium bins.68]|nr:response regulator transcription factor [Pseudanabaenaceae cyanobacterium bins.68]
MKILLVEDDTRLAEPLAEFLTDHRYKVDTVDNGESAWEKLQSSIYDLVILDVILPKLNGIDLCRRLRSSGYTIPVLMVTALDTSPDKVAGLEAGADDYVVKPLDLPELLARIRALMRRTEPSLLTALKWGDLCVDIGTHEALYGDQQMRLTPKEFGILELLVRNGHQLLRRTVIVENVWSLADPPSNYTINENIKSLRAKLKQAGAPDDLIETIHGKGYRLKRLD